MEFISFRIFVLVIVALAPLLFIRPKLIAYLYLGLIFYMPQILGFGVKKNVSYLSLYTAGTGILFRPLISLFLLGLFIGSLFLYKKHVATIKDSLSAKILLVLSAYFVIYAMLGIATGAPIEKIFNGHSGIHIIDMTLLMLVMFRFCTDEKELSRLISFLIFCVSTREVYGLIRFLFFGGDFSNVYANVEGIGVKVPFQDIGDSLLACLVGFYCAWQIMYNWRKIAIHTKLLYISVIPLALFTIMFTYRRSIWIGLVLAIAWFLFKQPFRRKIMLGALAVLVVAFTFTTLLSQRLGHYEHTRSSMFFYDVTGKTGDITFKQGRLTEIAMAYETIANNVILGVGPWGRISPYSDKDYMHGGVLQIWLKLGIGGLALFIMALTAFVLYCFRVSRQLPPEKKGLFEAGFAGVLFLMPDLVVGTPVVEYRTMQLTGLCMALPYIVYAINRDKREEHAVTVVEG
jgi:O-antigen ligase